MISARYFSLLGGSAAAVLIAAGGPALASTASASRIPGRGAVSSILQPGDVTTGVRGVAHGNVVLTGSAVIGAGPATAPFLYQGSLRSAAGAAVSTLTPPFSGETTATFYGPDTHRFNPGSIPSGQVRAVGSYQSSAAPAGVRNEGMIYLGPVSGPGGTWTSINVPADGTDTTGGARACPRARAGCLVMDTIAHSTMGNLVVGNYDLNPAVPGGLVSGNGFIYNLTSHQWTLLDLGGSQSSASSIYGIWQDGGAGSATYTLAGGSSASRFQQGFLMNYNERTGHFGTPKYYSEGNVPSLATHFEGITAVPGGFHLVALSSAQPVSMASIPASARFGVFGNARWIPVNVAASPLCSGGCQLTTGNTVYRNQVMGLYVPKSTGGVHSYLADVPAG
ncbi:MAG TPA: hypothetical protein VGH88_07990 [Streptosporangiaceae bacterium]|jgi:hypothetical protein